jgi:hypothetical protein
MRKQDIKPGVVYAYQRGTYDDPRPVVFLSLDLYSDRRRGAEGPRFRKACDGDKPHSGTFGSGSTGYLIAEMRGGWRNDAERAEAAERMKSLTLADALTSREAGPDDLTDFDVLPRLTAIVGPWDEVIAAKRARDEKARQVAQREQAERLARDDRAVDVLRTLKAAGVRAQYEGGHAEFRLSLDDAEKLASLLAAEDGDPR